MCKWRRAAVFLLMIACLTSVIQTTTLASVAAPESKALQDTWGASFSAKDVAYGELKWSCCYGGFLTKEEVNELVEVLQHAPKQAAPYQGPMPKGGPSRVTIHLTTGTALTFIPNGDYVLHNDSRVLLPELGAFAAKVKKRMAASSDSEIAARMMFHVTDAGTQEPVRKARVIVIDRHGEILFTDLTGKDGRVVKEVRTDRDPQFPTQSMGTITVLTVAHGYNEEMYFTVPLNEWGQNNQLSISLRKVDPKVRNEPTILNTMAHRFTVFDIIDYYANELKLKRQPQIDGNSLQWGPDIQ